jgi:hypothetical protein
LRGESTTISFASSEFSNTDHLEWSDNLYLWKLYPYASGHYNLLTLKNAERGKTWGTSDKERNIEHVPGS